MATFSFSNGMMDMFQGNQKNDTGFVTVRSSVEIYSKTRISCNNVIIYLFY